MTTPAPDLLIDGPAEAKATLMLAHGAGAPMDSPFMAAIACGLGSLILRAETAPLAALAAVRHSRGWS